MKITLASTSKFKNNILNTVGIHHNSVAPICDEFSNYSNPYDYVKDLSLKKATSIKDIDTDIIIGLDTIVLINDKIVEKPKNIEEAKDNLRNSSNNKTKVITGITLINKKNNETKTDYQETIVSFNNIAKQDIDYYIENEKDALYASGFIIETICSNFISKIEGSYYNILGVPVEKIYQMFNNWNIYLKDIE
ncbi:MAG: Maf family nucleotide pyrophosphatase [Candidatus Coprovivens sp.]